MTPTDLHTRLRRITTVFTDIDGVLTDGGLYYGESGEELKKFNIRDGAGAALLHCAGIRLAAMTGETRALNGRRLDAIGVTLRFEGVRDKRACLQKFLADSATQAAAVAFIGDEINDYALLGEVGVFFAPADACAELRARADVVLSRGGGCGVIREVAEILLRAQGKFDLALERYLHGNDSTNHAQNR